jgi:hypothetical protein
MKLCRLCATESFKIVFRKFVDSGLLEKAIKSDPTMSSNPDVFRSRLSNLMDLIDSS